MVYRYNRISKYRNCSGGPQEECTLHGTLGVYHLVFINSDIMEEYLLLTEAVEMGCMTQGGHNIN